MFYVQASTLTGPIMALNGKNNCLRNYGVIVLQESL